VDEKDIVGVTEGLTLIETVVVDEYVRERVPVGDTVCDTVSVAEMVVVAVTVGLIVELVVEDNDADGVGESCARTAAHKPVRTILLNLKKDIYLWNSSCLWTGDCREIRYALACLLGSPQGLSALRLSHSASKFWLSLLII
jgi:hypothetical protein